VSLTAPVDRFEDAVTVYPHLPDGYMSPDLSTPSEKCPDHTGMNLKDESAERISLLNDWFGLPTTWRLLGDACAVSATYLHLPDVSPKRELLTVVPPGEMRNRKYPSLQNH
jgi:hypothetical protein